MAKDSVKTPREQVSAIDSLSEREREVLQLAASGFLDKQIGVELGVSLNTLRTYWTRIRSKLGDSPRAALAVAYVSSKVPDSSDDQSHLTQHEGWIWDIKNNTLLASDSINDLHGLDRGRPHPSIAYSRLYHPEDVDRARTAIHDVAEGRLGASTITFRLVTEAGVQPVTLMLRPIKDREGNLVKVIGYRTRSLDCRPENGGKVRIGFFFHNLDTGEFWADESACKIYGVAPEKATDRDAFLNRHHAEDRERIGRMVTESVRMGDPSPQVDSRIQLADGSETWIQIRMRIRKDQSGHTHVYETVLAFD